MIRDGKKIPSHVKDNIPVIVEKLSLDREPLFMFSEALPKMILKPVKSHAAKGKVNL
jgi:hypothetical protein